MSRKRNRPPSRWTATSINALPPRAHAYAAPSQRGLYLLVREKQQGTSRTWLYFSRRGGEVRRLVIGHLP
ncbi:MAG TPA: hypothetical protein VEK10_09495, partial [Steroidobacteraceae bacterium]|nr:hypothetical protein [Steroidobacteraceae bacterium]